MGSPRPSSRSSPPASARGRSGGGGLANDRGGGRDSRVSGPMFHRATIAALQSVGCDVLDVGLAPTPTIQLAVEDAHAAGGLAITASHNPIEWNALKFIGPSGLFLDGGRRDGDAQRWSRVSSRTRRGTAGECDPGHQGDRAAHRAGACRFRSSVSSGFDERRFRVALDCAQRRGRRDHACAAGTARMRGDGRSIWKQMVAFRARRAGRGESRRTGTTRAPQRVQMLGLATDPDVDRLALVSDEGTAIGEDWTLALAARLALRYRPGTGGGESVDQSNRR